MAKRQYNQVCALSIGLDLIGDRWTLLIVRELMFGARRFSDILRSAPGLSTNLLSQRLKDLDQHGLIEQRKLPPPAASSVYMMTDTGRQYMVPIIITLTNFGVQYLHYPPNANQFVPASSTMGAMNKFFVRGGSYTGSAEFRTAHDVFGCIIQEGILHEVGFDELPDAHLSMHSSTDTFMGLIVGYVSLEDVLESGELRLIRGSSAEAQTFFASFSHDYAGIFGRKINNPNVS